MGSRPGAPDAVVPAGVRDRLRELDPRLSESTLQGLSRYLDLLLGGNRQMNLTRVHESDMWQRHVLDSLSLLPWVPAAGRLADLGSGGGLPGIPLALARPDLDVLLVESVGKKAHFLRTCAEDLALPRVQVREERIEALGRGPERGAFDVVTARALARLPVLLELAVPLLRVDGRLLAIKGEQAALEVDESRRALRELHAEVQTQQRTPSGTVLVVRKLAETPSRYPRRAGEPKRKPLV